MGTGVGWETSGWYLNFFSPIVLIWQTFERCLLSVGLGQTGQQAGRPSQGDKNTKQNGNLPRGSSE